MQTLTRRIWYTLYRDSLPSPKRFFHMYVNNLIRAEMNYFKSPNLRTCSRKTVFRGILISQRFHFLRKYKLKTSLSIISVSIVQLIKIFSFGEMCFYDSEKWFSSSCIQICFLQILCEMLSPKKMKNRRKPLQATKTEIVPPRKIFSFSVKT